MSYFILSSSSSSSNRRTHLHHTFTMSLHPKHIVLDYSSRRPPGQRGRGLARLRRPAKEGHYGSIARRIFDALPRNLQVALHDAALLIETNLGVLRRYQCNECHDHGWACDMIRANVTPKHRRLFRGNKNDMHKCSRCRLNGTDCIRTWVPLTNEPRQRGRKGHLKFR